MIFNNEQKGITLIILIIVSTLIYKRVKQSKYTSDFHNTIIPKTETVVLNTIVDSSTDNYQKKSKWNRPYKPTKTPKKHFKTFDFNPNTISKDSLIALGISSKTAYNWTKYTSKGGHFKIKTDIKKIYGITNNIYNKIEKHILLPDKITKKETSFKKDESKPITYKQERHYTQKQNYNTKSLERYSFDINSCSKEDLIKLNGIGEVLSTRIIKFRDKLGGFYSKNQIAEVYGLSKETFDKIKSQLTIQKPLIRKLKINIVDKRTLKDFPYISYRLAKQIINYRKQNGNFKNSEDFRQIRSIDSLLFNKIEPYLNYEVK